MNEHEMEDLENILRRSVPSRAPAVPDKLFDFIDAVPARYGRRPRLILALERPRFRRGIAVAATAAALVVAIAAGMLLVSVRGGAGSGPLAPAQWTWQKADGSALGNIYRVANGYVATCGTGFADSMCTSRDGLTWTDAGDSSVVLDTTSQPFRPMSLAHFGNAWAAIGTKYTDGTPNGTLLWHSQDGVRWSISDVSGMTETWTGVSSTSFGMVAIGQLGGVGSVHAWTSTDGLSWNSLVMPVAAQSVVGGGAGLVVTGSQAATGADGTIATWRTSDGEGWFGGHLLAGVQSVGRAFAVPHGFVALGSFGLNSYKLLESTDGLDWRVSAQAPAGAMYFLDQVRGHLVASVTHAPWTDFGSVIGDPALAWQSVDGENWQPLLGPDGRQFSGRISSAGDRGAAFTWDQAASVWHLTYLVEPQTPISTATPAPSKAGPPATPWALASANACSRSDAQALPIKADLDGLAGWKVAYEAWGFSQGSYTGCGALYDVAGHNLAVLATCDTAQTVSVSVLDASVDARAGDTGANDSRTFAYFDFSCPIAWSAPVVVFGIAGEDAWVGHPVRVQINGPVEGNVRLMLQTTNASAPAATP
jgi:hypothetical protein